MVVGVVGVGRWMPLPTGGVWLLGGLLGGARGGRLVVHLRWGATFVLVEGRYLRSGGLVGVG